MRALVLSIIMILLSACVYEKPLSTVKELNKQNAFVYGRFQLSSYGGNSPDIAIILKSVYDESEVYIQLKESDPVYAVEVYPGTYEFGTVGFMQTGGNVYSEKYIIPDKETLVEVKLEPGKAYYIGDFVGETSYTSNYPRYTLSWKMKRIKNDYGKTTTTLLEKYTQFSNIDRINLFKSFQKDFINEILNEFVAIEELIKKGDYQAAYTALIPFTEKGVPYAQHLMGYLYEKGLGVSESYIKAAEWYKKAAEKNHSSSMFALGMVLSRHSAISFGGKTTGSVAEQEQWMQLGSKRDGYRWIDKAAYHGDNRAMVFNCLFAKDNRAPAALRVNAQAWCKLATEFIPVSNTKLRAIVSDQMRDMKPEPGVEKRANEIRAKIQANSTSK